MSTILHCPPPQPPDFDAQKFFEGIHWHQRWEVFEGVFTPGRNPVADLLDYSAFPQDLSGKTVLDIGAWNGGFSFECARRGAKRVLGYGPDDPVATGFYKLRDLFGFSQVEYEIGSVYDVDEKLNETFDLVLFFGVIYHLRYPLLALDRIYDVCKERLFVESYVIDNFCMLGAKHTPHLLTQVNPELSDTPVWQFFQFDELNQDSSNWFGPNVCALRAAIQSAGFTVSHVETWGHRAAMAARKSEREFLSLNTYEKNPSIAESVRLRL